MADDPVLIRMARAMCPMDWEKASADIRAFWLERARRGYATLVRYAGEHSDPDTGNAGALE